MEAECGKQNVDDSVCEINENSSSDCSDIIANPDASPDDLPSKTKKKFKFVRNPTGFVSLYITSCELGSDEKIHKDAIAKLKPTVPDLNLDRIVETKRGLILNVPNEEVAKKILKKDLAKVFGRPVQVVPLYSGHYKKIVGFKDIPWCIKNDEVQECLKKQGIHFGSLTRENSTLYIEVSDFPSFQRLKEEGINFYDSVMFQAAEDTTSLNEEIHYNTDNIIQCYRCQGFWHTANTCKQSVRCVRCGEEHPVEHCNRPKSNPICCNCKGPHHAAYKLCPMRMKHKKSIRVAFTYKNDERNFKK